MADTREDREGTWLLAALFVIYLIGLAIWQDPSWPLTILLNFLGDLGIGHGTSGGYPWEAGSMGVFPHSQYQ